MATTHPPTGRPEGDALAPADPTLARRIATVVAGTFLLVGVLGFVPGITQNVGDITFAGHDSDAELLGIFQVSIFHNLVHLLFGVVGLAAARKGRTAVVYLLVGGVVYLVLAAYGAVVENENDANFVPLNGPDDVLHLVLGVGMIALGVAALKARSQRLPSAPSR